MITLITYSVGIKSRINGVITAIPIKKCVVVTNETFVSSQLRQICEYYTEKNLVVMISKISETEDKMSRIEGGLYIDGFVKDGYEYVKYCDIDIK